MKAVKINPNKVFKMYSDPGHGWLAVPVAYLIDAGVVLCSISTYSYARGKTIYLEEDCDAGKFISAWRAKYGSFFYENKFTDNRSPIRSYESFCAYKP